MRYTLLLFKDLDCSRCHVDVYIIKRNSTSPAELIYDKYIARTVKSFPVELIAKHRAVMSTGLLIFKKVVCEK